MAPTTIVLLHGFTQTGRSWGPTIAALGERYRALAPDLRGHGVRPRAARSRSRAATRPARARAGALRARAATRWAAGSRSRSRSRRPTASRGCCWSARLPGSRTPRSAAPAARPTRRSPIEIEGRGSSRSRALGALPLFAGQPPRRRRRRPRDAPAQYPAGLAAALRGLGTGVMEPLWERLPRAGDPGRAGRRRARREVPRDRRADGGGAARRDAARRPGAGHAVQLEAPDAVAAIVSAQSGPVPT